MKTRALLLCCLLPACSGADLPDLIRMGQELPRIEERFDRLSNLAIEACGMAADGEQAGACVSEVRSVADAVQPAIKALVDTWCSFAPDTEGCADR